MRVSLAGGEPIEFAKNPQGNLWFSDGKHVYGAADKTVFRYDVETGAYTVLATGQESPTEAVQDSTNIYWLTKFVSGEVFKSSIVSLSKSGGAPRVLFTGAFMVSLTLHDDTLFYDGGDDGEGIYKLSIQGGTPIRRDIDAIQLGSRFFIAAGYLYAQAPLNIVNRVAIGGGKIEKLFSTEAGTLFVDVDGLYFQTVNNTRIDRYDLKIDATPTLLCTLSEQSWVVFNQQFLFFQDRGRIVRMPKRAQQSATQ